MPDGSVIVVTPETHPELAVAMRGGGNQFGKLVRAMRMSNH